MENHPLGCLFLTKSVLSTIAINPTNDADIEAIQACL